MESNLIQIDKKELDTRAMELFKISSGFNKEEERYQKMMQSALEIYDRMEENINVSALFAFCEKDVLKGNRLVIEKKQFTCNAFQQMDLDNIYGIYVYMITAGSSEINDESVLHMLYADTWGTSYIDAGREYLEKMIINDTKNRFRDLDQNVLISDSFGPGFYGMDMKEMKMLFEIIDGEKINVHLNDSCLMLPQKSCAGFYFTVKNLEDMPAGSCMQCSKSKSGCNYCYEKIRPNL